MKKIRVLFHVTHLRRGGGIESSLMSWLRILDRERFEPGLSIAFPSDDIAAVFKARIPDDVVVHLLGTEPWLSHFRNLKQQGRIGPAGLIYEELLLPQVRKRVFRRRINLLAADYDVVIDYDLSLARFAPDFTRETGKPLVGISHFSLTQNLSLAMQGKGRRYLARARHYRRYARLVTLCDAMQQEAGLFFPEFADRFTTMYPGFDLDETRLRAALPLEPAPTAPYLVSVCRLAESQKDVSTLLKAYALAVQRHAVDEMLVIAGEGPDREALERLAISLGVGERVRFAGFVGNPLPLIAGARLLVLSSRLEGLPTALIEGLILGQVLVSSDCPTGPNEILDAGRAGLLVPPGDAEALCEALVRALNDEPLRERLKHAALQHSLGFGIDAFRQRFLGLLDLLPVSTPR